MAENFKRSDPSGQSRGITLTLRKPFPTLDGGGRDRPSPLRRYGYRHVICIFALSVLLTSLDAHFRRIRKDEDEFGFGVLPKSEPEGRP